MGPVVRWCARCVLHVCSGGVSAQRESVTDPLWPMWHFIYKLPVVTSPLRHNPFKNYTSDTSAEKQQAKKEDKNGPLPGGATSEAEHASTKLLFGQTPSRSLKIQHWSASQLTVATRKKHHLNSILRDQKSMGKRHLFATCFFGCPFFTWQFPEMPQLMSCKSAKASKVGAERSKKPSLRGGDGCAFFFFSRGGWQNLDSWNILGPGPVSFSVGVLDFFTSKLGRCQVIDSAEFHQPPRFPMQQNNEKTRGHRPWKWPPLVSKVPHHAPARFAAILVAPLVPILSLRLAAGSTVSS